MTLFRHHEILRVLVEEVIAAHHVEREQAETERKDILFHESWRLESDAQPEGVGRAERESSLEREAIWVGSCPLEFRRFDSEEIRHREVEREVGERHFLELALRELVAERDVREAEIAARNDAHIGIVVHRPVVVGKRFEALRSLFEELLQW